ncbi:hypothetical protein KA001_02410 [Patescibacteria group bacterium]|nr:hypothetical protein [Patescibacteria group bacterium]
MDISKTQNNYIVLNNVRSAYNVGSIIRLCDALGFDLILQGITPYPKIEEDTRLPYVQEKITKLLSKTATESINNVNIKYFFWEEDVVMHLDELNIPIYCLETNIKNSVNVFDLEKKDIKTPFALVAGNEVTGVDEFFLSNCAKCFFVPQYGKNKSLNVGFALAVAAYVLKVSPFKR